VSLYVVDRDYRIVTWNRHREIGTQGIPRDAALGRNVFDVLARYPEGRVREEFERAFRTGRIERIEQQTAGEDGATKHWMVSKIPMRDAETGEVSHVITVGEDITVRVEAIHAVARADKLAAVGRLAAGVVHEINNPLATISACAEALEGRVEEGAFDGSDVVDDLNEYLGLIKSEAFRCKSITTGLLDFSRLRTGDRHPLDIAEIIRSSANLVSHQKRGNEIKIEFDIKDDLPLINADGGQLQQAVIALATNAIDAMADGGTLTFRVFAEPRRVAIEVEDTGVGIPTEDLSKVFEPFFTTKEVGKGTGLGLAVCYGIITDHGGRLSARSSVGKGTTFTIYLPITERSE
jgi:two-component system, NtrC family, sensor kinase